MRKLVSILLTISIFLGLSAPPIFAIYDPLSRPNNFFGIHILFDSELGSAADLVNSSEGEWGYVTIPIQINDRDITKWQKFMDDCREKRLIPIIRLATEPYYKDTSVWRKPMEADIIDFANFLNSLRWPVENRYVIVFNEVNRFDEWGGEAPDPKRYAELLEFSSDVFKARNSDFYIIMAGLDNAAPNDGVQYMDNMVFIREMIESNPEAIKKMDGFSSHSYPNPGFSQPPNAVKEMGTATYKYEYDLINSVADKKIPAFITETGWATDKLSNETIAAYYKEAFSQIWGQDKDKIVAITPFLLNSSGGQFENFSFIIDGQHTQHFESTKSITKLPGEPVVTDIKGAEAVKEEPKIEKFFQEAQDNAKQTQLLITEYIKFFF